MVWFLHIYVNKTKNIIVDLSKSLPRSTSTVILRSEIALVDNYKCFGTIIDSNIMLILLEKKKPQQCLYFLWNMKWFDACGSMMTLGYLLNLPYPFASWCGIETSACPADSTIMSKCPVIFSSLIFILSAVLVCPYYVHYYVLLLYYEVWTTVIVVVLGSGWRH